MNNKAPQPFVQNHTNWCWATVAKIVGLHYIQKKGLPAAYQWECDFPYGVTADGMAGLIPHTLGRCLDAVTVDAWQYKIVENAKNHEKNPFGNLPEYDVAKVRALRYVVTGDANNNTFPIQEFGFYKDILPLYKQECFEEIERNLDIGFASIGNYINIDRTAHSVVIFPKANKAVTLYNPQDGTSYTCSYRQAFETGFLTTKGQAVIQWVQYITP